MPNNSEEDVLDPAVVERVHHTFFAAAEEIAAAAKRVAQSQKVDCELYVSPRLVYKTVTSAHFDIARYKLFHLKHPTKEKSGAVKRAAYFTKWIVRFRPILFLDRSLTDLLPELQFLNEHLAIQWSTTCIAKELGLQGIRLRRKTLSEFLYDLHFREVSTDGLLAFYQIVADLGESQGNNPIVEFSLN